MKKRSVSNKFWYISAVVGLYFFPIALIMISVLGVIEYKKSMVINKAILYSGIALIVYSAFMSGYIFFVSLVGGLSSSIMFVVIFIFPIIPGIYLIFLYFFLVRWIKRLKKCEMLIVSEHITSLSLINEITGYGKKRTVLYINELIRRNILDGASVDEHLDEIVFTKSVWARQRVVCKNCGGELIVNFGHTLVCDYCKGALVAERFHSGKDAVLYK